MMRISLSFIVERIKKLLGSARVPRAAFREQIRLSVSLVHEMRIV